ncbi:fungal-specific transcription factor domain-containing protein [Microdochium trichocladiopsis]|uniref:Fungal-specific transcription factor domain-containing protein n=1 Tax=Microdochium trichocladiopsis TaxID=1682393 RepID=A0A9P8Y9B8_9PEZI|nr:fungal-specific transcription factor domain-containing protein [Microdochium trichocladiopsis]KAH7033155.1 fungal-specific transcription factor domain-containing protein [Microdochium trichocladiopsis]
MDVTQEIARVAATEAQTAAGARKRTLRACDRCSLLRVRCDGRQPCRRCQEYEQSCHYARSVGKRGRRPGSKKQAQQQEQKHQGHSTGPQNGDSSEADHDSVQRGSRRQVGEDKWYEFENTLSRDVESMSNVSTPTTVNETNGGWHHISIDAVGNWKDAALDLHQPQSPPLSRHRVRHDSNLSEGPTDRGTSSRPAGNDSLTSPSLNLYPQSLHDQDSMRTSVPDSIGALTQQNLITVPSLLNTPEAVTSPAAARSGQREVPESARLCRFRCLEPVVPLLQGIIDADLACELLEMYFVEPGGSLFKCSSPYVLTHVLRKESLLRHDTPRKTTPALLVTMLWVSAQTADSSLFLLPGQKTRVCEGLRKLMIRLTNDRDRDSWHRITDGSLLRDTNGSDAEHVAPASCSNGSASEALPPVPMVDDVLVYLLLTIVVSGGDFKIDCLRWWTKTLRLSHSMGLNREDEPPDGSTLPSAMCTGDASTCPCRACDATRAGVSIAEVREERRRAFWLIFCLDRHLALSFNAPLRILDDECQVYAPLPDDAWESLASPYFDTSHDGDSHHQQYAGRAFGAPTRVLGIGFFEWFLPLMTILGDVITLHRLKSHPRFSGSDSMADSHEASTAVVEQVMESCEQSIADLAARYEVETLNGAAIPASQVRTPGSGQPLAPTPREMPDPLAHQQQQHQQQQHYAAFSPPDASRPPPPAPPSSTTTTLPPLTTASSITTDPNSSTNTTRRRRHHAQAQLVTAYSSFILHVLHVLLHGKWDAVSMLDNKDGWIPSVGFIKCASHAVAASDAVSRILACDPELSFMPYLFGIYLLHGSFILLLFADRMPQIGLNESVERACEIIIRAHEVCVVTLSTEFQKRFRKVLRSTLYSVRSAGTSNVEESKARRRALSLYRWSSGSTGLAL